MNKASIKTKSTEQSIKPYYLEHAENLYAQFIIEIDIFRMCHVIYKDQPISLCLQATNTKRVQTGYILLCFNSTQTNKIVTFTK